jgi:hypothetical protein
MNFDQFSAEKLHQIASYLAAISQIPSYPGAKDAADQAVAARYYASKK